MTRALATCLALCVLAEPAFARPEQGSACVLTTKVRMSAKKNGRGKKTPVRKDTEIKVLKYGSKWTKVRVGRKAGFLKTRAVEQLCVPVVDENLAPPAPPEPLPVDDEPETITANPTTAEPAAPGGDPGFVNTYKIKIAVLDLRTVGDISTDLVASLTGVIPETLESLSLFQAISTQEIQQMLQYESDKQLMGCDDMSCIAEIGGALGADFFITGGITLVDGSYVIQMQMANIREARVESRASREYAGDSQGLFDQVRSATKILVRDLLGERSGTLMVKVNEEGASIKIDGSIVGVTPLAEPMSLAGGTHELVVEKQRFVVSRQDITITPERRLDIDVSLIPSADFITEYEEAAGFTRGMAWLSVSVGAAGLGGATALYFLGRERAEYLRVQTQNYNASEDRSSERYDRLNRLEEELAVMDIGAIAAAGIGVVATGVGITLFAVGDDPGRYDGVKSLGVGSQPAPALQLPSLGVLVTPSGVALAGEF